MKLYKNGVYLINGTELLEDTEDAKAAVRAKTGKEISKEEAAQHTIAYGILKAHNTSGDMEKLKIKFDKLTSHDITFVGIIQTARASGLEKPCRFGRLAGSSHYRCKTAVCHPPPYMYGFQRHHRNSPLPVFLPSPPL